MTTTNRFEIMKMYIMEHAGCFEIHMEAEDNVEAATLVRFGMNHTKEIRHLSATVGHAGGFDCSVVIAKHKKANNEVPKR